MGSGDWFKTIISRKKVKEEKQQKARKALRHLKGIVRVQALTQVYTVKKQASTTMDYLHSWSRIQSQIRARRISMVTEGRIKQKKLENQLKLDAKLHELEVEWCGGSETMEDILARMYQREEAAVKRERAMAYAFSHQWRANSSQNLGQFSYELGKANWGWSWIERWIAARPWESRVPISPSPKIQSKQTDKLSRTTSLPAVKVSVSVKPTLSNGKGSSKARRLSYPNTEKPAEQKANPKLQSLSSSETEETNTKQE
ncbi:protein IQ-DOMAIN 10-like isoform X2 [Macadamia integrifolia]|uniref:protein IQ-DOMAIN 10-like isoform X2 n=1 Tax=Macadamia integrifolia TaxID=60698 RepID=UPI001C4EA749|nr:protein IQ-DOMAIN 10-like isoform X2 [Macadamia integrifolia]